MVKPEEIPAFIKEETRKRCHIFRLDESLEKRFRTISPELFHFLYEASAINFHVYFRIDHIMIEFMKKNEFSQELLDQMMKALQRGKTRLEVAILKKDFPAFEALIDEIRQKKIQKLIEKDPALDPKVLQVFSNLSGASQLIVRGGITPEVAQRVKAAAGFLMNNLMDNQMAMATLSRMVIHDPTLYDHSASVAMLAGMIAQNCVKTPLKSQEAEIVAQCGLYHDVGKTCVPSFILNKPGKFTPEEFEVMKTHAELGEAELMKVIEQGAPIDPLAARVAGEHHERFCGQGYPRGRKGRYEEDPENGIHLFTRIVTIADVYSALLMKRVYKPAFEPQDAIKIMADVAANEYDPEIFNAFIHQVIESLNAYQKNLRDKSDRGRLMYFDESGKLVVHKKQVS